MRVTVIGAGPGGYEAALYAAKCGCQVTLVEKDKLGGTCLNKGCIPTKSLLAVTDNLHGLHLAEGYGIHTHGGATPVFAKAFDRKNEIVSSLVAGVEFLMKANQVQVISGTARLKGKDTVAVMKNNGGVEMVTADRIILATGSVPAMPQMFGYDGKQVISSDEALSLTEMPRSIVIVGGGVIGCEIGQFLRRMGCEVTIVEMLPHLLPHEDKDVARVLERQFKQEGIRVICGQMVASVEKQKQQVQVVLQDGTVLLAEKALISIGRSPATTHIGLDSVGIVRDERGYIPVDGRMRTKAEGIYAIGDIVATAQLAHVAVREAFVAVDDIVGQGGDIDYRAVPRCVYTSPEVASVGLTEEQAKEKDISVAVGRYDFKTLGKAKAAGKPDGFVKILTDERDVVVGGAVVGAGATELLQSITMAVQLGITAKQLGEIIYPHPTLCEAIMEAAHDVHKMSVHKVYR